VRPSPHWIIEPVPWRPLILLGLLVVVVAIPLLTGDWVSEGPWFRLFGAAAATLVFLYWFYTRDEAEAGPRRGPGMGPAVLVGCPMAAVVGSVLAGASLAMTGLALIVGLAFGFAFFLATP